MITNCRVSLACESGHCFLFDGPLGQPVAILGLLGLSWIPLVSSGQDSEWGADSRMAPNDLSISSRYLHPGVTWPGLSDSLLMDEQGKSNGTALLRVGYKRLPLLSCLSFLILSLHPPSGGSSCHAMSCPTERPTWQGTGVPGQQPVRF